MLTVLSLREAQQSESLWQSLSCCTALHITDRIDQLRPEDFCGLGHVEQLIIGPRLEEIHAENCGWRPSRRSPANPVLIPESIFRELRSLRQLEIKMKGITELQNFSFAHLPYLECLKLSGNRIRSISSKAFEGLANLRSLHLDQNRLTEIEKHYFAPLSFLHVLRLDSNRIKQVHPKAFAGTPFLIALGLQRNRISRIDPSTFEGLDSLSNLNLGANQLGNRDLKFLRHLGHNAQISIETKTGSLTFSRSSLARAL